MYHALKGSDGTTTTKNFTNPGNVSDPDLRRDKAASVASGKIRPEEPAPGYPENCLVAC